MHVWAQDMTPDQHTTAAERLLDQAREHFNENGPDMRIAEVAAGIAQVHLGLAQVDYLRRIEDSLRPVDLFDVASLAKPMTKMTVENGSLT